MNRLRMVFALVLVGLGLPLWAGTAGDEAVLPLATAGDLVVYPVVGKFEPPTAETLYAVALPGVDRAVLLRAISREEYGAFQVQAVGHEWIDRQMLAAAVVLPALTESDIGALLPELVRYLQRQVNRISGFAVFSDVGP